MQSESILILLRFPVVYRDDAMPAPGGEATQHQGAVHGDPIQALGDVDSSWTSLALRLKIFIIFLMEQLSLPQLLRKTIFLVAVVCQILDPLGVQHIM